MKGPLSDEEKSLAMLRERNGVSSLHDYFHEAPTKHNIPNDERPGAGRVKRMSKLYEGAVRNADNTPAKTTNPNFSHTPGGLSFTPKAASAVLASSKAKRASVESRGGRFEGGGERERGVSLGSQAPPGPPAPLMPFSTESSTGARSRNSSLLTPAKLDSKRAFEPVAAGGSTRRKSILSLSDYFDPTLNPPTSEHSATPTYISVVDPLRASILEKERELRELKKKLQYLTEGNSDAMQQLLLMVYKLDKNVLPDHHFNAIKTLGLDGASRIKKIRRKSKEGEKSILDLLSTPAGSGGGGGEAGAGGRGGGGKRRVSVRFEKSSDSMGWSAQGSHVSPTKVKTRAIVPRSSPRSGNWGGNASLGTVNEFLRKEAMEEGEKLYEKEWGKDGKYGKSMFLADSMRRAKEVVEREREKRAMEERMKPVALQTGAGRDRSQSYWNTVDRERFVKGQAKLVAEERMSAKKKTLGRRGGVVKARKKSITFSPETKSGKLAVKMDAKEAADYLRWKHLQQQGK